MRLPDQLDDLGLLGGWISDASSSHPQSYYFSRRFTALAGLEDLLEPAPAIIIEAAMPSRR
jgi:hypothetical protein